MKRLFRKKEYEIKVCGNCGYWVNLVGHGLCSKDQKGTGKFWYCLSWKSVKDIADGG